MNTPLDVSGRLLEKGDTVECVTYRYPSIDRGDRRTVQGVIGSMVRLRNPYSPCGYSDYTAHNFKLVKKGKTMVGNPNTALYVAVPVEGRTYEEVVVSINEGDHPARANTSYDALKNWVTERIRAHPDEKWLILSSTVLAEISAPPVSFRPAR